MSRLMYNAHDVQMYISYIKLQNKDSSLLFLNVYNHFYYDLFLKNDQKCIAVVSTEKTIALGILLYVKSTFEKSIALAGRKAR